MVLPDPLGPTITIGCGVPFSSKGGLTWHSEIGPVFCKKISWRYIEPLLEVGNLDFDIGFEFLIITF